MNSHQDDAGSMYSRKISEDFQTRLSRLDPDERIGAVVLLEIPSLADSDGSLTRVQRRSAAAQTAVCAVTNAFDNIDRQLALTGGCRITRQANRIGHVSIEASAASIYALAEQDWVRVIVENQSTHLNTDS